MLRSEAGSSYRHCTPLCSNKTKLAKDGGKGHFFFNLTFIKKRVKLENSSDKSTSSQRA